MYDITILTDRRYVDPVERNDYVDNVLLEDKLLQLALEKKGLNVFRTNWDNADFNWATTRYAIFRTTWDYFDRYEEFAQWMKAVEKQTVLLNSKELIQWNIDKHYLGELSNKGINIPSTVFIEKGDNRSLESVIDETTWDEFILKPVISGAARNTFRIKRSEISDYELKFRTFISQESYMVQEFQQNILTQGEISLMVLEVNSVTLSERSQNQVIFVCRMILEVRFKVMIRTRRRLHLPKWSLKKLTLNQSTLGLMYLTTIMEIRQLEK